MREVRAWNLWSSNLKYSEKFRYYYWANKSTPPTIKEGAAKEPNFTLGDWTLLGESVSVKGTIATSGSTKTYGKPVVTTWEPKIFRYIMLTVDNDRND